MVATRTRTASLPAKKATYAEEQATATRAKQQKRVFKSSGQASKVSAKEDPKAVAPVDFAESADEQIIQPDSPPFEEPPAPRKKKSKQSKPKARSNTRPSSDLSIFAPPREGATTFLDVPPELRNEIYSYVLRDAISRDGYVPIQTMKPYVVEPALLAVNRQVRTETLSLFYGDSAFWIEGSSMAVKFLRSTDDEKLRALRTVYVSTNIRQPPKTLITRLQQLLREFQPRGLRRSVLHMIVADGAETEWMNLPDMLRSGDD